jgi:hypothetical protein
MNDEPQEMLGLEKTQEAKKRVLENLKEVPIVTLACRKAGIARATYYRWIDEDYAFRVSAKIALDSGISFINDLTESQLVSLIKEGRMPAITLWLKHHHPRYDRGDSRREQNERDKIFGIVEVVRQLEAGDI